MQNERFTGPIISKSLLFMSSIIWLVANYVIYYFFENIVLTCISTVMCITASIIFIRNRRYLCEYDNATLVVITFLGYWFWLLSLITVLVQIKSCIPVWLYFGDIIPFVPVCIYSYKKTSKPTKEKIVYDFDVQKKLNNKIAKLSAGLMTVNIIFNFTFSESQALLILSVLLLVLTLFAFWLFSSCCFSVYRKKHNIEE